MVPVQWLNKQPKALIGIDIGARYIKVIVLTKAAGNTVEVTYAAIKELPMMVLTEGNELKDHATISATLTQLKLSEPTLCQQAAIALPGSSVVTKNIILPADLSAIALEEQVWFEASKYFPDLIEDLSLDFHIQGPSVTDATKLDILLVACRKTSIEQRLNVLHDSHFQVQIVDVDYYALERSLRHLLSHHVDYQATHVYALIHVNSRSNTLVVIQGERLLYAYDQSFDGQRLLQKLQQSLDWPNIVTAPEQLPADLNEDAEALLQNQLIGPIQHALQLFNTSTAESPINRLFVAGDIAMIPTIATLIQTQTTIPTGIAQPLAHMKIHPQVDKARLEAIAPLLTLCCGLALQVIL